MFYCPEKITISSLFIRYNDLTSDIETLEF